MNTQYQKTIKPFIEKPFIPTEVDKLQEKQKINYSDISMTSATLVGPRQTGKGSEVKINLYLFLKKLYKTFSFKN